MMTPNAMANYIIGQIQGLNDPAAANSTLANAIASYVMSNAQVFYSWSAVSPPPASTPDPTVLITATVTGSLTLTPSGANTPEAANLSFSNTLNAGFSTWTVVWPPGFALSPALLIPTISITPSGCTDMNGAWLAVCGQIIAGLKTATPAAAGSHGAYVGAASFTQIL